MENLDTTGSPNLMGTESSRLSPGLGPGVDVGAGVGWNVGAGPGATVALEGASVTRVSLTSAPAQANATKAQMPKMPKIETVRKPENGN